ncbi:methyltransferase domain-containing protein [Sphingobium sp. RSMS]|uniref:class I SAM-dependent methyltransferase n=1 Tax=Sphingobium sp. RSMS TaxID=520734 RepID=UPI0010F94DEA|nr:class I SAM-dependent methyltransferase [Sphingobium sp. RSMS]UXC89785.1 methyltransferase domain-containing protein [Sphingobium sp. RSMS]
MVEELERFDPGEQRGRIAYEHLHRYAICQDQVRGKRVLDIACGTGYGSAILASAAAEVVGIDISAEAVGIAQSRFSLPNLTYQIADCFALPFADGAFDIVVANEMIEHVADHEALIREAKRVLATDGALLVSTPNKPVYNRFRTPNVFHISEVDLAEFARELQAQFAHVQLTGTRMALVSMAFGLDDKAHASGKGVAKIYGSDMGLSGRPQVDNRDVALEDPEYILAICSDAPIARSKYPSSLFFSKADDLWIEHEKIMAWASQLHEEDEVLRAQVAAMKAEVEPLRQQAAGVDEQKNIFEAQVAALDRDVEALREQVALRSASEQTLTEDLQQLREEMATIKALADRKSAESASLRDQLAEARRDSDQQLSTTARLLTRLTGEDVAASSIAIIEALFALNEAIALQKARMDATPVHVS